MTESTFPDGECTTLPLTPTGEVIGVPMVHTTGGVVLRRRVRDFALDVLLFAMGEEWVGEAVKTC